MSGGVAAERAGLYVHIPFCMTRCGYCDFNTYAGLDELKGAYVDALVREAELAAPDWAGVEFASVFFGGGTPTSLPVADLVKLLDHFRTVFDVAADAEITSEANPDTVDREYLGAIRGAGVKRLSLGVQSFDPDVLEALERIHSPASARGAYSSTRAAGFGDINLDLIYGAHGETLRSWESTLTEAVAMAPEHLSCYALTIEPATSLGRKVAAGLVPEPDPDLQADMYDFGPPVRPQPGLLGGQPLPRTRRRRTFLPRRPKVVEREATPAVRRDGGKRPAAHRRRRDPHRRRTQDREAAARPPHVERRSRDMAGPSSRG